MSALPAIFLVVVKSVTNPYLIKVGWRTGMPVRRANSGFHGGPVFALPYDDELDAYPNETLARESIRSRETQFNGCSFEVVRYEAP